MRPTLDENGYVCGFPYHDGDLDGVLLGPNDTVHLALRSVDGERRILTLLGVTQLSVDDFARGNSVADLRLQPASQLREEEALHRILAQRTFLDPDHVPEQKMIFMLETSYGADIIAICDGIDVQMGELVVKLDA